MSFWLCEKKSVCSGRMRNKMQHEMEERGRALDMRFIGLGTRNRLANSADVLSTSQRPVIQLYQTARYNLHADSVYIIINESIVPQNSFGLLSLVSSIIIVMPDYNLRNSHTEHLCSFVIVIFLETLNFTQHFIFLCLEEKFQSHVGRHLKQNFIYSNVIKSLIIKIHL